MNKLSFVLPCYKVKLHINRNKAMWKKISKIVDLIWVEDTSKPELEELVKEIGGKHFSKENGNWGSVINFVRKNNLVNTDYVAIVDPDDMLSFEDLIKLIIHLSGDDLYITNYLIKDFKTGKINKKSYKFDKYTFIHQIWFKTKLFNSLPMLPENHFFMDNIVMSYILSSAKTFKTVNTSPYIYFVNFDNQSTAGDFSSLKSKLISSEIIKSEKVSKSRNKKLKWRLSVCRNEMKYHSLIMIRAAFDNEIIRDNRKKLINLYKKESNIFHPVRTWILWSKLYVVFKR